MSAVSVICSVFQEEFQDLTSFILEDRPFINFGKSKYASIIGPRKKFYIKIAKNGFSNKNIFPSFDNDLLWFFSTYGSILDISQCPLKKMNKNYKPYLYSQGS